MTDIYYHDRCYNHSGKCIETLGLNVLKKPLYYYYILLSTVEALVSGHPRDGKKVSVTGAGRLREWFS